MRTITKQLVLLAVVFIIYFGYSAWIDGLALYRVATIVSGAGMKVGDFITDAKAVLNPDGTGSLDINGATVAFTYTGFMAQNSLLYAMLSPFKLVLVGGVFAMLIPLTKKLFLGTIIAIKDYIKNRRNNLLYNYQASIAFTQGMKAKLETGDYEQIKAQYATLGTVAFKPQFLLTLMEDVGYALIKETDMSLYVNPAQTVIDSLQEMYESEHRLALTGHPEEMFHDFKAGYNYVSIGSKYNIAYYKSFDAKVNKTQLGWKLFSLEMYKFYISMILAIVPEVVVIIIVIPILDSLIGGPTAGQIGLSIVFLTYMLFAITINALMVFLKSQYRLMLKHFIVPAVSYYLLMFGIALTFSIGLVALIAIGDIIGPQTSTKIWAFISALANLVFTTCLILFVAATLMDSNVTYSGLTTKLLIDGIVLPMIAWVLVLGFNLYGMYGTKDQSQQNMWMTIAFVIAAVFWVYLAISGILLNNIVLPSKHRKKPMKKKQQTVA